MREFDTAPPSIVDISYKQPDGTTIIKRTQAVYNTGLNSATAIASSKWGKKMEALESYESYRLVAGGFRLWKTSVNENESGVIRAMYA